jgi:hypothetical protein
MEERYREQLSKHGSDPGGEWEYASLGEEKSALTVRVRGERELALRWDHPVAFRVIDEGARLRQKPLVEAAGAGLLYEVRESVFLDELNRLSEGALGGQQLTHYLVWTSDQCVDVVAAKGPELS